MKVTDAEAAIKAVTMDLVGLPREMATAIHSSAAGAGADDEGVTETDWASYRKKAKDPSDLPSLDGPVKALQDAVQAIRDALPKLGGDPAPVAPPAASGE